ncbi:hypothetical protein G3R49_10600 [Shewanella sp. WXL01]|uniref:Uncharacterized protein n=1 Tax=Shewanella maritima TaxID=2520507 RepID=A0A411PKA1_9GAMM|nr:MULTISPECIES: hypothetical protein [Shewanella]NKF51012.1 hypothetical protein [Shewanella sp. WXL01]QBF83973.1 hypothetical protein EXU30_15745 [Shewanella maritima]
MVSKNQWIAIVLTLACVIGVIVYQHLKATEVYIVLSCRNELVASDPDSGLLQKHGLIADFTLQNRSASISYRYFTHAGLPIATLHLQGDILSAHKAKDVYVLNLVHSELVRHHPSIELPQHANHLQAFANRNIDKQGVHNLTIRILKTMDKQDLALLYFLPSTNICACNLVKMR